MCSWLGRMWSACWRPVKLYARMSKDDDCGGSGRDNDDGSSTVDVVLVWCRDLERHSYGDFSFAGVQANEVIEDHSQVDTGCEAMFVSVYDGHGSPDASRFISDHLFLHLLMSPYSDAKETKVVKKDAKVVNQSSSVKELDVKKDISIDEGTGEIKAKTFRFDQLVAAIENFKLNYFLGEGGFGKVYKGRLEDTGQIVAIKQLDRNGQQGIREFIVEVLTLSQADHPKLVKLIGYCAEGDQRLLVYKFMPLDVRSNRKRLDWNTRMNIAAGAARGLEYLQDKMKHWPLEEGCKLIRKELLCLG